MNWYQSMWWNIKYELNYHWVGIAAGIVVSILLGLFVWKVKDVPIEVWCPPRIDRITNLAEGNLVSIRSTGAFSSCDTELKFADGSMILVTYGFSRRNNLKEGHQYKIWYSSFYGNRCKELK